MVAWKAYLVRKSIVRGRWFPERVETRVSQSAEKLDWSSFLVRAIQTSFEGGITFNPRLIFVFQVPAIIIAFLVYAVFHEVEERHDGGSGMRVLDLHHSQLRQ
ncbi:unnamed protein product [Microthlaspi erraticum]|uniref:Uncharacterized protein n=1 Tax=Microthlaspi erraticum TaxID=1685480 RepID=A0A6D2HK74_9BRAS|nr:unnamed protein product [Microthlaspi erraticum]